MQVVLFPLKWSESISNFAEQINMSDIKYDRTIGVITGATSQIGFVFKVKEGMPKAQFLELVSLDGDTCLLSDTGISEYK